MTEQTIELGDTVRINSPVVYNTTGTVVGFTNNKIIVATTLSNVALKLRVRPELLTITTKSQNIIENTKIELGDNVQFTSAQQSIIYTSVGIITGIKSCIVTAICGNEITVTLKLKKAMKIADKKVDTVQIRCKPSDAKVTSKSLDVMVVCYHCGKLIKKSEAFYLQGYDAYYDEEHYLAIQNGETIRMPNYRRGDA